MKSDQVNAKFLSNLERLTRQIVSYLKSELSELNETVLSPRAGMCYGLCAIFSINALFNSTFGCIPLQRFITLLCENDLNIMNPLHADYWDIQAFLQTIMVFQYPKLVADLAQPTMLTAEHYQIDSTGKKKLYFPGETITSRALLHRQNIVEAAQLITDNRLAVSTRSNSIYESLAL